MPTEQERPRQRRREKERESEGEATRINHKLKCFAINSSCSIGKTAKPTTLEKERATTHAGHVGHADRHTDRQDMGQLTWHSSVAVD